MARLILRLERAGANDVWAKAAALEMWVRGAVHILNREIAEASAAGEPDCPEEAHALSHMRAIAIVLLALTMFLQSMKDRLPRKGAGQLTGGDMRRVWCAIRLPPAPHKGLAYLDSS